jgi:hypothetical protein
MKAILKGIAIAILAVGAAVKPVRADIATSMTASLSGNDIMFYLTADQAGTFTLADLSIGLSGGWTFDGNLANLEIREGGPLGTDRTSNYTPQFVDGNLTLLSNTAIDLAQAAYAPIWIKVGLSSFGSDLTQITYQGDFYTQQTGTSQEIRNSADSFGGTVTPEPTTVLLLGSGLAGLAGIHRRRKKREDGPIV